MEKFKKKNFVQFFTCIFSQIAVISHTNLTSNISLNQFDVIFSVNSDLFIYIFDIFI